MAKVLKEGLGLIHSSVGGFSDEIGLTDVFDNHAATLQDYVNGKGVSLDKFKFDLEGRTKKTLLRQIIQEMENQGIKHEITAVR